MQKLGKESGFFLPYFSAMVCHVQGQGNLYRMNLSLSQLCWKTTMRVGRGWSLKKRSQGGGVAGVLSGKTHSKKNENLRIYAEIKGGWMNDVMRPRETRG